jgi:hypothetical protein
LARAVRTKSIPSTSIIAERTKREKTDRFETAIVTTGRTRKRTFRCQGCPESPTPEGGSHCSATLKTRIRTRPSQKAGTASPSEVRLVIRTSAGRFCRTAARQPSGSPISTATQKAVIESRSVFGNASAIRVETGRLLTWERPRLSWATSDSQTA